MNRQAIDALLQTIIANQELQRLQLDRIEAAVSLIVPAVQQHGERITRLENHALNGSRATRPDA